jgi:hypothetical protein
MPPTPTHLPPGNPQISIQIIDAWEFTDYAIHGWQFAGNWTTVIQAIVLLFIIGYGIIYVQGALRGLSNDVGGEDGD